MPELPEVEIIRRGLEKYIVGKTIVGVEVRLEKIFIGQTHQIVGARIEAIRRFGKGLVIDLSNGYSITAHVKMTGQFVYVGGETQGFHPKLVTYTHLPDKHTHVIFSLSNSSGGVSRLFYNDIRQFGWLRVVRAEDVLSQAFFKSLGPEPFRDLTIKYFRKVLASSNMPIKPLLMDQRKISGIGNIYANDALYLSRIDPRRKSSSLTKVEIGCLFRAILEVLEVGLKYGGASEMNYIHVDGTQGEYQKHFLVYGQGDKACRRCGGMVKKIKQAGRGTFYCPNCQI